MTSIESDPLVVAARLLATQAHAGQVDKAGRDYIDHPARVASRLLETNDPVLIAVAWLHDVLEDCPGYEHEVRNLLPDAAWVALTKLTRKPGQDAADYYEGIRIDPIARIVKLADIGDNLSRDRLALLDEQTAARLRDKYLKALDALFLKIGRDG